MKTVYQTNDGAVFENFETAYRHEFEVEHPHLRECKFLNLNNRELSTKGSDIFSDTWYGYVFSIEVPSEEALTDLIELAKYNSWRSIESDINDTGRWHFYEGHYHKVDAKNYTLDNAIALINAQKAQDCMKDKELYNQLSNWLIELKKLREALQPLNDIECYSYFEEIKSILGSGDRT